MCRATAGHATVTFHVDDADWPLPADTTASIRLATLLGQKYVQLVPGQSHADDGGERGDGPRRPPARWWTSTRSSTPSTSPLATPSPAWSRPSPTACRDRRARCSSSSPASPACRSTARSRPRELVARNGEFNAILINLGITADQLNTSSTDLAGLIDNTNSVTAALAADQGRALTGFITNTDALNTTTARVLGGGSAAALEQRPAAALRFRHLAEHPPGHPGAADVDASPSRWPGAEPSDFVNGNNAIPSQVGHRPHLRDRPGDLPGIRRPQLRHRRRAQLPGQLLPAPVPAGVRGLLPAGPSSPASGASTAR